MGSVWDVLESCSRVARSGSRFNHQLITGVCLLEAATAVDSTPTDRCYSVASICDDQCKLSAVHEKTDTTPSLHHDQCPRLSCHLTRREPSRVPSIRDCG